MLELDPNQIDLWFVFFDDIQDEHLLEQYRRLLTEEERHRQQRFYFPKDQRRYLITRALVRTVLSRYAPIAPKEWTFSTNAYGKPEIANDSNIARKLSFNVSHTQSLIVLGITYGRNLGVDTENIRIRKAPLEIARHFFSPAEAEALYALPLDMQHDRFYQYWTLKEAYIKARGMGLSIPLDQFSFRLQGADIQLSIDSRLNDEASRWRFWQFGLSAGYLTAICAEVSGNSNLRLRLRKIVPLGDEEGLECVPVCY